IERARLQAIHEGTTLNQLFCEWLTRYVTQTNAPEQYDTLMEKFGHVVAGGTFVKEEMNDRY
ncbi:MAG: hypothetical protein IAF02_29175, partial [Anaerolineae bacterium]|nr:hypothetical protein [Anaerolineae bacterium]